MYCISIQKFQETLWYTVLLSNQTIVPKRSNYWELAKEWENSLNNDFLSFVKEKSYFTAFNYSKLSPLIVIFSLLENQNIALNTQQLLSPNVSLTYIIGLKAKQQRRLA